MEAQTILSQDRLGEFLGEPPSWSGNSAWRYYERSKATSNIEVARRGRVMLGTVFIGKMAFSMFHSNGAVNALGRLTISGELASPRVGRHEDLTQHASNTASALAFNGWNWRVD